MTNTPETPEAEEESEPKRMKFDGPSVSITDELKTSYLDYAMSVIFRSDIHPFHVYQIPPKFIGYIFYDLGSLEN